MWLKLYIAGDINTFYNKMRDQRKTSIVEDMPFVIDVSILAFFTPQFFFYGKCIEEFLLFICVYISKCIFLVDIDTVFKYISDLCTSLILKSIQAYVLYFHEGHQRQSPVLFFGGWGLDFVWSFTNQGYFNHW